MDWQCQPCKTEGYHLKIKMLPALLICWSWSLKFVEHLCCFQQSLPFFLILQTFFCSVYFSRSFSNKFFCTNNCNTSNFLKKSYWFFGQVIYWMALWILVVGKGSQNNQISFCKIKYEYHITIQWTFIWKVKLGENILES